MLHLRNRHYLLLDILLLAAVPSLALGLRVELPWDDHYGRALLLFTALGLLIKLPVFYAFRLYNRYWRYASIGELIAIVLAVMTATALVGGVFTGVRFAGLKQLELPRSVPFIDGMLTLLAAGGTRFGARLLEYSRARDAIGAGGKRVLIVGAGDAGAMVARELRTSARLALHPVGFVDDDPAKRGMEIHGVRVLGAVPDLPRLVEEHRVQQVIIAMPAAPGGVIRQVVRLCAEAGVSTRTLPGIFELLSGDVSVSRIREVSIEDLLRREPVEVDASEVRAMLAGARVLVTGAGGSIGSELCRQILRCGPAQLVALGHGENRLFDLERELRRMAGAADLRIVVADLRDRSRLEAVFERHRPQLVFHAAAHKHVPLMEANPEEAVSNNVLGTRHLVELSEAHGVERFVFISSDKAVNPANVMGATKRVAEAIVRRAAYRTGRPFVSVRFGNVLGSRGSVVPVFKAQIAAGGPLTVTHPEVTRYFMTIPEAVQLVLQAGAMGHKGEVFVLDMGEPIRIADLARDLVALSGLKLGEDIEIEFTGLRPGEKLYEELFQAHEAYERTRHAKIFVGRNGAAPEAAAIAVTGRKPNGTAAPPDGDGFDARLEALLDAARRGAPAEVRARLQALVPDYAVGEGEKPLATNYSN